MSSTYGERLRITIFGQSHSAAIGVTMEGIPAGDSMTQDMMMRMIYNTLNSPAVHTAGDISLKDGNVDITYLVDESYLATNPQSLVHRGDFIVADTSEDVEGCGNCVYVDSDLVLFAGYHTIILFDKEARDNKYFAYLFVPL